jgi:hypothetical protein
MPFVTAILFDLDTTYLSKEALEEFGEFKIRRQVIGTVKYEVTSCYLLRKKQYYTELLRLAEVKRCYGIDLNVVKTKEIGVSRQLSPLKIII